MNSPYFHLDLSIFTKKDVNKSSKMVQITSPFFTEAFFGDPVAPVFVSSSIVQNILRCFGKLGIVSSGILFLSTKSGLIFIIAEVSASPPWPNPSHTLKVSGEIFPINSHQDSKHAIVIFGYLSFVFLEAISIGAIFPS